MVSVDNGVTRGINNMEGDGRRVPERDKMQMDVIVDPLTENDKRQFQRKRLIKPVRTAHLLFNDAGLYRV